MSGMGDGNSRRAFFVRGGALLGAGVAAAAVGRTDDAQPAQDELSRLRDREAIRQLHLAFAAAIEHQSYEAVAALFDERAHVDLSGVTATGHAAIRQLFEDQYRHQKATLIHARYRQNALQHKDLITFSDDGSSANATYHVDVQLSAPLQDDCTAAQMARLQGQMAACYWEAGRLDVRYAKTEGRWKMASVRYSKV
ncbi:MAG TPA: nuclear transport factor 2 family protein [Steroidobacteraceae bacterium]